MEALESRFLLASPGSIADQMPLVPSMAQVGGLGNLPTRWTDGAPPLVDAVAAALTEIGSGRPGLGGDGPQPLGADGPAPEDGGIAWEVEVIDPGRWASLPIEGRTVETEEVDAPSVRASAPMLDRAEFLELHGHIGPGDASDLYGIPVDSQTGLLRVNFQLTGHPGNLNNRVIALDAQGRVLVDRPIGPVSGQVSLALRPLGRPVGSAIFVGIYQVPAAGPVAPGSAPVVPQPILRVDLPGSPPADAGAATSQDPAGSSTPAASPSDGGTSSAVVPNTDYIVTVARTPADSPPAPDSPATVDPGPWSGAEVLQAPQGWSVESGTGTDTASPESLALTPAVTSTTGGLAPRQSARERPAPLRSSSPAGGRLANGPTTRSVDRRVAAVLDLALADLPADPNGSPGPSEAESEADVAPHAAIAHHAGLPIGLVLDDPERTPDWVAALRIEPEVPVQATGHLGAVAPKAAEVDRREPSELDRRLVRSGLGLAYALSFAFLLPDLTAAFQRAAERPRRRSRLAALWRRLARPGRRVVVEVDPEATVDLSTRLAR